MSWLSAICIAESRYRPHQVEPAVTMYLLGALLNLHWSTQVARSLHWIVVSLCVLIWYSFSSTMSRNTPMYHDHSHLPT